MKQLPLRMLWFNMVCRRLTSASQAVEHAWSHPMGWPQSSDVWCVHWSALITVMHALPTVVLSYLFMCFIYTFSGHILLIPNRKLLVRVYTMSVVARFHFLEVPTLAFSHCLIAAVWYLDWRLQSFPLFKNTTLYFLQPWYMLDLHVVTMRGAWSRSSKSPGGFTRIKGNTVLQEFCEKIRLWQGCARLKYNNYWRHRDCSHAVSEMRYVTCMHCVDSEVPCISLCWHTCTC